MGDSPDTPFDRAVALQAALKAADAASQALLARFRPAADEALDITVKGPGALLTDADLAADRAIADVLTEMAIDANILSEESADDRGHPGLTWLIDPLCGTTPFSTGLPMWGVNIALRSETQLELGVLSLPTAAELFSAVRGQGAARNGQKFTPSEPPGELGDIAIGVEVDGGPRWARQMETSLAWTENLGQVYSFVSGAYPQAQVLLGRMHAVVYHRITAVHIAAAAAIAAEIGVQVTDASGNSLDWTSGAPFDRVIMAWPRTHEALLSVIAS